MNAKSDARVNISVDAPIVPFGEFRISIREQGQETKVTQTVQLRRDVAPYSLPSSTGDGQRLVFSQGASR